MAGALIFRILGSVILGLGGWVAGAFINEEYDPPADGSWDVILCIAGSTIGLAIMVGYLNRAIRQIPPKTLNAAIIGLALALGLSAIVALPLSLLPGAWGEALAAIVSAVLIYLMVSALVIRNRDIAPLTGSSVSAMARPGENRDGNVILDTNSIIDGRIADIIQTGFIHGTMIIPKFVLEELHYIAASPDPMRKARGRRGLDILTKLQKESDIPVKITDMDFEAIREVDSKLVELAKVMRCPIVTNDVNLNRVASLQGVRILNMNELANALKPVVLPGEEMRILIAQEGKEHKQGIGYLDDGTMVVVEGGRRFINKDIDIIVSRVLQTSAGRMIFASPKS